MVIFSFRLAFGGLRLAASARKEEREKKWHNGKEDI
jgi:hypothetical protein